MLGVFITVALVLAFLGVVFGLLILGDPDFHENRRAKARAIAEVKMSRNHQDLFLLVLDLVTLQERGYLSVFPDEETLGRAKQLLAAYREIGT